MGKKTAFVSALGGQGCTVAAACIGMAAASAGHSVTLVDAGGFGGTLADVLGVGEEIVMTLSDAACGECSPDEALIGCGENLRLLPSGCFSEKTVSPCSAEFIAAVETLAAESDVFADLPSGTVPDAGLAECFDLFIVCARPDRLSLKYSSALCRHIRKVSAGSAASCEIRLLITRFHPDYMRLGGVSDLDECIDTAGARLIGVLPQDHSVMEAVMSGKPPDAEDEFMRYARDVASRIYGARVPLDGLRPFRLGF